MRTTKWNSFLLWSYVRKRIMEGTIKPAEYEGLKVLAAQINEGTVNVREEQEGAEEPEGVPTEKIEKGE